MEQEMEDSKDVQLLRKYQELVKGSEEMAKHIMKKEKNLETKQKD